MKAQPKITQKKKNWYLPIVLVAAIIIFLWFLSRQNDDSSTSDNATSAALEPINATGAQKLASIDALSITRLAADDKRVLHIDTLLNILSATYKESPEVIANATYVAHEQLKRMAKPETNAAILEYMSMMAPTGARYKDAVMTYVAGIGK